MGCEGAVIGERVAPSGLLPPIAMETGVVTAGILIGRDTLAVLHASAWRPRGETSAGAVR